MNLAKMRLAPRTPWAVLALIILAVATLPKIAADDPGEDTMPELEPKS